MNRIIAVIIGILIFTTVVGVFALSIEQDRTIYNKTIEPNYQNVFDTIDDTFNDTEALGSSMSTLSQQSEGVTSGTSIVATPPGILSAIRSVFGTVSITRDIGSSVLAETPLPPIVVNAILIGILIIITLIIVGIIIDR